MKVRQSEQVQQNEEMCKVESKDLFEKVLEFEHRDACDRLLKG